MIYIKFSVTQLKHQGAGIWGAIMKMGRFIEKAGSKIVSSSGGKVIKPVAAPVIPGLIEMGVSYGLPKVFNNGDKEAQKAGEPPQAVTQQGSGIRRAGYGFFRASQQMYGLGVPFSELITVFCVIIKLVL